MPIHADSRTLPLADWLVAMSLSAPLPECERARLSQAAAELRRGRSEIERAMQAIESALVVLDGGINDLRLGVIGLSLVAAQEILTDLCREVER